ncbi:hypothetical protein V1264_002435 [Littorina saxatilis]|uniref:Uncharacterized protein n=1 Tax=Littorina saxatilis TaxID=31220 RepID=A0AAN9GQ04_9CAEN
MHVSSALSVAVYSLFLAVLQFSQGDGATNDSGVRITDEQRLYRRLRVNYDPHTRPVYNASHPVVVKIGITLTQIFDLDEKNQVLTTNVWLDHEWTDEKMRWDPEEYNGLKVLRIPCKHIWKPDIVLYNSVEDYTDGYMQALAMVKHDGNIFWPPIVKFHSTCQIDITFFPFDDQVCSMKLGSWAYDGFQVDVVNRSSGVDLSNYVSNGEWMLLKVETVRNVIYYPCCPEPFPDVRFIIYLRRRTLYYTYNVIIPCVMLSTLTLLVFWMSPESGEKVTLGLTVLLAFSVFMLLIAENMPATSSYVPLIGVYLTSVMALTSVSVVLAVLVSNISYRGRKDKVMPRFLRVCVTALARVMCFRLHFVTNDDIGRRTKYGSRNVWYKGVTNLVSNDSGCSLMDLESNVDYQPGAHPAASGDACFTDLEPDVVTVHSTGHCTEHDPTPQPADITPDQPLASSSRSRAKSPRRTEFQRSWDGGGVESSGDGGVDLDDIVGRLRSLLQREEEKDSGEDLCRQWQEAAEVIDRFLFWIFVVSTVLATVTSLVFLPLTKQELDANVDIFET